ncbi:MAG TPA: hypothetical protein VKV28_07960 [Candidatus Binataceae bacterium]|nr:hypothetical protein [Candidatus Binataceae bacterium]
MNTYQPCAPATRLVALALALLALATFLTFDPYLAIMFALAQVFVLWLALGFVARLIRALSGAKPGFRPANYERRNDSSLQS